MKRQQHPSEILFEAMQTSQAALRANHRQAYLMSIYDGARKQLEASLAGRKARHVWANTEGRRFIRLFA